MRQKHHSNTAVRHAAFHPATLVAIAVLSNGCASVNLADRAYDAASFQFVRQANERPLDPDRYFAHEYAYINTRRGDATIGSRPSHLLGLTMSGGGIRSAAFHQGLLAGLHSARPQARTLLEQVDYISSVSGGSWANGFYWSNGADDDHVFHCLDAFAATGTSAPGCTGPLAGLRDRQALHWLPINEDGKIEERKLMWEEDIVESYLGDCNFVFGESELSRLQSECARKSLRRPYPIFNSTHSASGEASSREQFPFESTPDHQGTLIDDEAPGFFLRSGDARFLWQYINWQRSIFGGEKDIPGSTLSLMLAHSSGVVGAGVPFLLQYDFRLRFREDNGRQAAIEGLRPVYHLTDGGKSDNLGLLPLLERGVETIVVSQIGKEKRHATARAQGDFDDLILAARQAEKLLGCTFRSDWHRTGLAPVISTGYRCPHARGRLVLIRPTLENVAAFMARLQRSHPALHEEVVTIDADTDEDDRFPETPTFRMHYPPALIRAYYLLGRHLAETAVADALREPEMVTLKR
ncbi:patatin-like phospholipase family protein [Propionivibrio dicarboxylicus]|uniref:Patatin-like phospholipase n=1 Tax=Propionivibrio dicarboxylicus TaxID=83767 RepID=A0A1G8A7J6_9RHOO|nr:patatin-like phospholipase family protein [Propionivibrio dicarboxylicus]SDH16853.1 Patatin-like phospholipase [Propionivibrio dicarboxylicus]